VRRESWCNALDERFEDLGRWTVIERYQRDGAEFDRAVAFIDATFAVALTLLVTTLDIKTDPESWSSVSNFYDAGGAQLVAFGVSFVIIAGYWLAHFQLFATFVAVDMRVIVANLVLLAAIVILPFTTEYAGDPAISHLPLPIAVVSINVAAVSTAFTIVYVMARRRGLLRSSPGTRDFTVNVLAMLVPGIVFLVSVPIAYAASPEIAQLSWLALVPLNAVLGRMSTPFADPAGPAESTH
jgi:uncharacterized membrane protein